MLVTLFGMVMLVKPAQPENALLSILVALVMITSLREEGTDEALSEGVLEPKIYPKDV